MAGGRSHALLAPYPHFSPRVWKGGAEAPPFPRASKRGEKYGLTPAPPSLADHYPLPWGGFHVFEKKTDDNRQKTCRELSEREAVAYAAGGELRGAAQSHPEGVHGGSVALRTRRGNCPRPPPRGADAEDGRAQLSPNLADHHPATEDRTPSARGRNPVKTRGRPEC